MNVGDLLINIVILLGGLGVLLVAINLMSEATEKLANDKLRVMLNKVTNNKLKGVGIGAGMTAIIQSSSATTVMTVSLVNVGILTLTQAVPIIMGANIGTTITAQVAALQSFDFSKFLFLTALVGAFIMLLGKKDTLKTIGTALAGFGALFVALWVMSSAMKGLQNEPAVVKMLVSINNPFLLLAIGLVLTAAMQSSSAVTSLIISSAASGISIGGGGNAVLFIILGTNIGTCVTALLSIIGAGTSAKRTALVHFLFNVIGSVVFAVILLLIPTLNEITFMRWFPKNEGTQIAMFHTFFNIITTLILLPLSGVLVFLATKMIPDRKGEEGALSLSYLDERLLGTPSIAVAQVIKEIGHTVREAEGALTMAVNVFTEKEYENISEVAKKREKIKFYTQNITKFLVKISSEDISYKDEKKISSFYHAVNDIERIADYSNNICRYAENVKRDNLLFSDTAIDEVKEMYEKLKKHFDSAIYVFESRRKNLLDEIERQEDELDQYKRILVENHIARMNAGDCSAESGSIFINFVGNLERVGDHLTSIARTVQIG